MNGAIVLILGFFSQPEPYISDHTTVYHVYYQAKFSREPFTIIRNKHIIYTIDDHPFLPEYYADMKRFEYADTNMSFIHNFHAMFWFSSCSDLKNIPINAEQNRTLLL